MHSSPMVVVEAEREEDEEEKKVASKDNHKGSFKVPQKLHEFRLQAAAKDI